MNPNVKKVIGWGTAIGVSGGVIVTILVFALNAYVKGVVEVETKAALAKVPTIENVDNKLTIIADGIADNAKVIGDVAAGQERFELLFTNYLIQERENASN